MPISEQYREYLLSQEWQDIRADILERDNHMCQMCGSKNFLQVHHINGKYRFHESEHPESLVTLCDTCHKAIHRYFEVCDGLKEYYSRR